MGSDIRLGQLISPFGPGSLYTDKNGVPTVVCGLDYWHKQEDENGQLEESARSVRRSLIFEKRLSELLNVSHFRQPPEFIYNKSMPELSKLSVQGHRFPRWYVNSTTGRLRRFNLETIRLEKPESGYWKPVRFIAVCEAGHMSDFPWKIWSGCTCDNDRGLILNDSGGVDLSSITVRCSVCNNHRSLTGATMYHRGENGEAATTGLMRVGVNACDGERPWLGEHAGESNCDKPLTAVLINQSNIYFPNTVSSIFLPDLAAGSDIKMVQEILDKSPQLPAASLLFKMDYKDHGIRLLREILEEELEPNSIPDNEVIFEAFNNLGGGRTAGIEARKPAMPDSDLLAFRRSEFNILRTEVGDGVSEELRILPAEISPELRPFFSKVNLVERLRETKVFYGFERLERSASPLDGMPEKALQQLFLHRPGHGEEWLPAVKSYGEGIYLELPEEAILNWLDSNGEWLENRYQALSSRMVAEPMLLPPSANCDWKWSARYQLVHTLSHILINQLVFESGYSSASLKERLFVSPDRDAPMAGVLIYTASGDSEGSLGGLVRLGRAELFEGMLRRALARASWCSTDPVCSENMGGAGSRLVNMAACQACTLLPETACETINNGLDRGAVVGIPEKQEVGFLSSLLSGHAV